MSREHGTGRPLASPRHVLKESMSIKFLGNVQDSIILNCTCRPAQPDELCHIHSISPLLRKHKLKLQTAQYAYIASSLTIPCKVCREWAAVSAGHWQCTYNPAVRRAAKQCRQHPSQPAHIMVCLLNVGRQQGIVPALRLRKLVQLSTGHHGWDHL